MSRKLLLASTLLIVAALLAGCATPALQAAPPLVETGVNPENWALVPAGTFFMGQHEHEVEIPYDYRIMVTDVTVEQYAAYLNEALDEGAITLEGAQISGYYPGDLFRGHHHEEPIEEGDWPHLNLDAHGQRILFDGSQFSALPGYGNHPVTLVTWFGARAYCEFYGWRLPLETEWERAARGEDNRAYPWGDEIARNQANYYSSHDLFEKIAVGLGDTTPVGFYNGRSYDGYATLDGASPYGLYDMAGNVWQWTGDVHEGQHYRTMRGGSRADYAYNLRLWTRNNAAPVYASVNLGFRCVEAPAP